MYTTNIVTTISELRAVILFQAVLLLLLSAVIFGKLVTFVKLPKVVGEILGGFIIGPSMLGRAFPVLYEKIFFSFDGQGAALSVFFWLGLAFLMFSSGHEVSFENVKTDMKIIGWLVAGATIPPFILGYIFSDIFFVDYYLGIADSRLVFNIIFAISTTVTSLPVISKIFMDLGLINHRFARIILATSTVQDLFLWPTLSVAISIITNEAVILSSIILHITATLAIFAIVMIIMPRLKKKKLSGKTPWFTYDSLIFLLCLLCICTGGLFNVNIMYSAFIAGMIYKNAWKKEASASFIKLKDMCLAFFTPIYFAIIGLRIYVDGSFSIGFFLSFLAVAFTLELIGCVIAMKCIRLNWLTSLNLGIAMNARGGPGIVVATIAFDLGIINYEFFCVLIFVVLITSAVAGYWIDYVNKKGKLLTISK